MKVVTILFCLLFMTACGQKEPVYIQNSLELCPQPIKPQLPQVIGELASEKNLEILYERELQVRGYIKRLENALLCYEKQVKLWKY